MTQHIHSDMKQQIWDVSSADGSEFSVTQVVAERLDTEGGLHVFSADSEQKDFKIGNHPGEI